MRKPKAQPSPADVPFTEHDWNFDDVPNDEVIACCLWEDARESSTIALAAEMHWCNARDLHLSGEYERNPKLKAEHDEMAVQIGHRAKAVGFDYDAFLGKFWEAEVAFIKIYET